MGKLFFKNIQKRLLLTDYSTIGYFSLTGLLIVFFYKRIDEPLIHLLFRVVVVALLLLLAYIQKRKNNQWLLFIRLFLPIILLTYVYGETAALNKIVFFNPLDPWFVKADQWLFGFQPSLKFSEKFPQKWFGELMNLSYLSYYFMLIGITLSYYFFRRNSVKKVIFIILTSFYFYYLLFILIPVVGPQYYFKSPDNEALQTGVFSNLVQWVQKNWEHPTGAFPSSHVGMAIIYLFITYRDFKKPFYFLLPFCIFILFATVYIKAHYAVDVIGGILSAPALYYLSLFILKKLLKK